MGMEDAAAVRNQSVSISKFVTKFQHFEAKPGKEAAIVIN
jgi:hypothetical protein